MFRLPTVLFRIVGCSISDRLQKPLTRKRSKNKRASSKPPGGASVQLSCRHVHVIAEASAEPKCLPGSICPAV